MIDIGGPSLIRAAAKNYSRVCVVVEPEDYDEMIRAIENQKIDVSMREKLALKAFQHTAKYDSYIQSELSNRFDMGSLTNDYLTIIGERKGELRYAENPHQKGIFFGNLEDILDQINGKELSYNNLLDIDLSRSNLI